ncbi:hypothetical protein [Corynebacterium doosanense]|uniref:Uncharacterized protein n=1 Tax=Corynebacterium doosanense CAU 212 = DSM 45436 TaxID=558173 RepID=A0A097IJ65_9CORY|nr:hypothetical protein [Corynebacterium doosanense]AIT62187.1 hypothetical protein CDOO_02005 [Corynebacterium doosanense CAU 212 = DSM 45436]
MTIIKGHLKDVAGKNFEAQGTALLLQSRITRPAENGGGVILQEIHRIPLYNSGGKFTTPALDPGPIRVEIAGGVSHGTHWDIDLPAEGTHELADLIGTTTEWTPVVVARAEEAARRAEAARDEAVEAEKAAVATATKAEKKVDRAVSDGAGVIREVVKADADRAEAGRTGAEAAAASAKASASAANTATETVTSAVTRAEQYKNTAAEQATNAAGSASTASQKAGLATSAANTASQKAADAAGSASASSGSASTASQKADLATSAANTASTKAADSAASAAAAAASEKKAADTAAAGVADATTTAKGKVKLAGDLAGTADAPTVPALAGKANTGHTHPRADVTGLTSESVTPTASTVVLRDGAGRAQVAAPAVDADVSTKKYVDDQDKILKAQVEDRFVIWPYTGTKPTTAPSGAVVGDYLWGITTAELSRITGV